jgi:hypothetical protein
MMQRQEIEQTIYKMAQQLPTESLEDVLQFMKSKTQNKPNKQNWQRDFLTVSQWDINENDNAISSWHIEEF